MESRSRRNLTELVVMIALVVLILVVYWQVQGYKFIDYDDQLYVTDNYSIHSGITFKSIKDTLTDVHTGHWHPLTMMSHMLDWELFGDKAGGHHWTSVIIHILNTLLLFLLFRNLTGAIWESAFIAALFAIHPLNVESVAWIAERKNVLSTFFWILTMIFYLWYVQSPGWKRYLPVFICFALGLMCKPMLVTLPFVLLLLDYWPLQRIAFNSQNEEQAERSSPLLVKKTEISFLLLEKIPLFILVVISMCLTIYAAQAVRTISSLNTFSLETRFINTIYSYALYLKQLFWPIDLAVFYPHYPEMPIWKISVAALIVFGITVVAIKFYRKYPYLAVGWFWYLVTLVPVIGLVQVGKQAMADRYVYFPFIGIYLIIAWGISKLSFNLPNIKIFISFLAAFMIIIFTFVTYNQVKLWKNTVTLFESALRSNPNNYLAYNILGLAAANVNDDKKALYYYYMALKIKPNFDPAYNNAGNLLLKKGKIDDAIVCYKKALKINSTDAVSEYNLGTALLLKNDFEGAVLHFNRALELQPDYIQALGNLGVTFIKMQRFDEAVFNFNKILKLNPDNENAQKHKQMAITMKEKIITEIAPR